MNWNNPPTDEFAMLSEKYSRLIHQNAIHMTYYPWLTLMKGVLNDYWMDNPYRKEDCWDFDCIEHFIHKIYYCWYMTMKQIHGEEE